jgi:hypothetical protein
VLVALAVGLGVVACTASPPPAPEPTTATPGPSRSAPAAAVARTPDAPTTLVADAPPEALALATSRALFERAPVVVLAAADDLTAQLTGASSAVGLGAPLLLTGPGAADADLTAELDRLATVTVLVLGSARLPGGSDVESVRVADLAATPGLQEGLTAATAEEFGDVQPVPAGQEVAAVLALVPGQTPVLATDAAVAAAATTAPTVLAPGPDTVTATPALPAPEPSSTPLTTAPARVVPSASAGGPPGEESSAPGATTPSPTVTPTPDPSPTVPHVTRPEPPPGALVLTDGTLPHLAALATARAAGVAVVVVPGGDPRALASTVEQVAAARPSAVLALGSVFGTPELLGPRVASAATGAQLPGGGQLVFPTPGVGGAPGKTYVALYGTPGSGALGVLGEQDVPATLARTTDHAAAYRPLTPNTVVPALEIIATIASGGPEPDSSYSRRRAVEDLRPLVDAAGAAGMLVILDLQPGRTDFLTQAQAYSELLALPHVGLALDPEWRLAPDQVHLRQIGSVGVDEVNTVVTWLAAFTRERALPQKLLVLHQFRPSMIAERERLDLSHDELAVLVHVDGQGGQPAKAGTWARIREGADPRLRWGWKNFYDEDVPMLDPAQTMQVQPVPDLVTYQ